MAWVIGRAVVRGELDNTIEGLTTGRIWLLGGAAPLELELHGDCWRDLAGSRVEFENPAPEFDPDLLAGLAGSQRGLVGDMTASRRSRGGIGPGQWQRAEAAGADPDAWRNCLYIEWFSEANGRVVIESDQFEVHPCEPHWRMDADAEQAQKIANLQAMRDYLAGVIRRQSEREAANANGELSEREWEDRLAESERLTDAYQEALEKYVDEADAEQKEAFVMGWDGLLGALADQHESGHRGGRAAEPPPVEWLDPAGGVDEEVDDWDADGPFAEDEAGHPLQELAEELAVRASDLMPLERPTGSPAARLVSQLVEVSAKLAGALDHSEEGYQPETGYVLAVLKRCLQRLGDAIEACAELVAGEDDPDHLLALQALHRDLLVARDDLLELCRELRSS